MMKATNRQKKLLKFFKIPFSSNISVGAAGWEIGFLMENEINKDQWDRYLYLTKDFSSDDDELKPYSDEELKGIIIPDEWSAFDSIRQFRDELVERELADLSPFDTPQPRVRFKNKKFIFTGKFKYGTRKDCQLEVESMGGCALKTKVVSRGVDYLVIGEKGSPCWRRGAYGNKIQKAILSRREHGQPAIISEKHWLSHIFRENLNDKKNTI